MARRQNPHKQDGSWYDGCGRYGVVPLWLIQRSDLSARAIRVFAALATYASRDGQCWPSRERLAADTGYSVATVQRALAELVRIGAVTMTRRGRRAPLYQLHGQPAEARQGEGRCPVDGSVLIHQEGDDRSILTHQGAARPINSATLGPTTAQVCNARPLNSATATNVVIEQPHIEQPQEQTEQPKGFLPPSPKCSLRSHLGESPRGGEPTEQPERVTPEAIVALWNEICGSVLPRVRRLTPERRKKLERRLRDGGPDEVRDLGWWRALFQRIVASRFLTGRGPRRPGHENWRADFDWAIRSETVIARILEGRYDDAPAAVAVRNERPQAAPAAAVEAKGEAHHHDDIEAQLAAYTHWIGYPEVIARMAARGDEIARLWCERHGVAIPAASRAG